MFKTEETNSLQKNLKNSSWQWVTVTETLMTYWNISIYVPKVVVSVCVLVTLDVHGQDFQDLEPRVKPGFDKFCVHSDMLGFKKHQLNLMMTLVNSFKTIQNQV